MAIELELVDSRRLTGANLFWDWPAAILDVHIGSGVDASRLVSSWQQAALDLLGRTGHAGAATTHRLFEGGASFLISAPIDALYSMCDLNEVAWAAACAALRGTTPPDLATEAKRLHDLFAEESSPLLRALQDEAHRRDLPFLWDDDAVSVGYGARSLSWPVTELPEPGSVPWDAVGTIPVALVTGTNGKSTTVRLVAAMIAAAGLRAGLTSTDWIRVGERILDTGDYSGTGGARTLLRHPDTEIAILETARGGLLRRGLGVERADAALITNVAADHLGEYGINTVAELTEAKFIVRRALHDQAPLVLNADDAHLVAFASKLETPIAWFGLNPDSEPLRSHLRAGGLAASLQDGCLMRWEDGQAHRICAVEEMPITLGGAARHNVANALGALLLGHVMGLPDVALAAGLTGFRGDETDNPGRGNWFEAGGVRILVDFAHNEHGVTALADMVAQLPARRRTLLLGQAGDRQDRDIALMTAAACRMRPDRLMVCDLPGYERGRAPGVVPRVIRSAALEAGLERDAVELFDMPTTAAEKALEQARDGDLLVFLALSQRQQVLDQVHDFVARHGRQDA